MLTLFSWLSRGYWIDALWGGMTGTMASYFRFNFSTESSKSKPFRVQHQTINRNSSNLRWALLVFIQAIRSTFNEWMNWTKEIDLFLAFLSVARARQQPSSRLTILPAKSLCKHPFLFHVSPARNTFICQTKNGGGMEWGRREWTKRAYRITCSTSNITFIQNFCTTSRLTLKFSSFLFQPFLSLSILMEKTFIQIVRG